MAFLLIIFHLARRANESHTFHMRHAKYLFTIVWMIRSDHLYALAGKSATKGQQDEQTKCEQKKRTNAFERRRQRHTAQTKCVTHVFKMNNERNEGTGAHTYYMQKANSFVSTLAGSPEA